MIEPAEINLAQELPFILGGLEVRPSTRHVCFGDLTEVLEPRVMQVLVALARRRGEVASRDELIAACWGGRTVVDEAIRRCIGALRRLAEAHGGFSISTVARVGYRLDVAPRPTDTVASPQVSICVLPFANMSGDPEQEYFGEGLSEDIITDLANVPALFVVARNTAFTFKGENLDLRQVARQLNVSHVLEGSVRKAGSRVRISAQLIDGATGGHLWAKRYDRDLADIFALQDEIARAVVLALKLELLPHEKQAAAPRGTTNADAYDLYLMARRFYLGGNHGDARTYDTVVRLCRRATELDPEYARAWALTAKAQRILLRTHGIPGDAGLAAAERAISIDPESAEAHVVRASVLLHEGRREEYAAELDVALSLDPESYEVNAAVGAKYFDLGRFADAARHYEKGWEIEPAEHFGGMLLTCYTALADQQAVQRTARMTVRWGEQAVVQDPSNGVAIGELVVGLAALGEAGRARDWARRALAIDPDNLVMRYNLACAMCAYLRDADTALELLAEVIPRTTRRLLNHSKSDPELAHVRDDPRFQAMIAAAEASLAAAEGAESPATAP